MQLTCARRQTESKNTSNEHYYREIFLRLGQEADQFHHHNESLV